MVVIIDYGVGNLTSIMKMIVKSGHHAVISSSKDDIEKADKIILPGMGHFDNCMRKFNASGLRDLVTSRVLEDKIPTLGICVGLQMFFKSSAEGVEQGLNWLKGNVVRFDESKFPSRLPIPNMGWLDVRPAKDSYILQGLNQSRFYFAHSFHILTDDPGDNLLQADYGYTFTAAVESGNLVGVQFHPEKSHRFGMQLLGNFSGRTS